MPLINGTSSFIPKSSNAYVLSSKLSTRQSRTPTNAGGVAGTASWGPPIALVGSPADAAALFGGVSALRLTDPYDLCWQAEQFFKQASEGELQLYMARVTDGTDAQASKTLKDTTSGTALDGITLTAKYSGILGNSIVVKLEAGTVTNSVTVTIIRWDGQTVEVYKNLKTDGSGASNFWNLLAQAINGGLINQAASDYITAGAPNNSAIAPALGTFTLTGGTDGRSSVAAADVIGDATTNKGLYALRAQDPPCSGFWAAGVTGNSNWAAIAALADSEEMLASVSCAFGTSVSTAVTQKKTAGLNTQNVVLMKDWCKVADSVNKTQDWIQPDPILMGRLLSLGPGESPGNKQVQGVYATEAATPYGQSDLEQLESNGINLVTKPIPRGQVFGVRHGQTTSSDDSVNLIPFARMTNYLKHSYLGILGPFVHERMTYRSDDATRAAIVSVLNTFHESLKSDDQIAGHQSICDLTNNTIDDLKLGFCRVLIKVEYMGIIKYLIATLNAGLGVISIQEVQQAA